MMLDVKKTHEGHLDPSLSRTLLTKEKIGKITVSEKLKKDHITDSAVVDFSQKGTKAMSIGRRKKDRLHRKTTTCTYSWTDLSVERVRDKAAGAWQRNDVRASLFGGKQQLQVPIIAKYMTWTGILIETDKMNQNQIAGYKEDVKKTRKGKGKDGDVTNEEVAQYLEVVGAGMEWSKVDGTDEVILVSNWTPREAVELYHWESGWGGLKEVWQTEDWSEQGGPEKTGAEQMEKGYRRAVWEVDEEGKRKIGSEVLKS